MTPRPLGGGSHSHSAATTSQTVAPTTEQVKESAGGSGKEKKRFHPHKPRPKPKGGEGGEEEDEDDESREHLRLIMNKYRDRAKERRHGETSTDPGADTSGLDLLQATAGYRAMAPDARTNWDAAERRRRMIEESKYLGGDMEHTHLVKGLDYALLQKVRTEIAVKEREVHKKGPQPSESDVIFDEPPEPEPKLKMFEFEKKMKKETEREVRKPSAPAPMEEKIMPGDVEEIRGRLAKEIHRILFSNELAKCNDLFAPRRMAYLIELEDEVESDIPTTILRSKAECPTVSTTTMSPNDVVIQKLTQVLSYLRTDQKRKKKEKAEKGVSAKEECKWKITVTLEGFYSLMKKKICEPVGWQIF